MEKQIYIDENQVRRILEEATESTIQLAEAITNNQIKATQQEITDYLEGLIQSGDPTVTATMKRLGFNVNPRPTTDYETEKARLSNAEGEISREVSDDLLRAAEKLKQYVNPTGGLLFKKMEQELSPAEIDELMTMRDALDRLGLNNLYDNSIRRKTNDFGLKYNKNGQLNTSGFDVNKYTKQTIKKYEKEESGQTAVVRRCQSLLNRYLDSKFGINMYVPQTMFSNGSHKLPIDTLIVNFASAERCPAWNWCIVKNACYARGTEKFRGNQMHVNAARQLLWMSGLHDSKLLTLLFRLLREYVVNYDLLSKTLKEQGIDLAPQEMSSMLFSELPQEAIELIKKSNSLLTKEKGEKVIRRITDIRLNENGDFLSEELVRAVDDVAGDFKIIGVNVAAYTCRVFKKTGGVNVYNTVKNIILNVSHRAIDGPSVARRFYALEADIYDAYDETYGGPDNSLVLDENGRVQVNPQPFADGSGYYYKCPCERLESTGNGTEVDCYMCRACYSPLAPGQKPYYVFVRVHGHDKDEFTGNRKHNSDGTNSEFGISANFHSNLERIKANKGKDKDKTPAIPDNAELNEDMQVMPGQELSNEDIALDQVVDHGIWSQNRHITNMSRWLLDHDDL